MKKIIIITFTIILGIYIHNLIIGNNENSLRSAGERIMSKQLEIQKIIP